MEKKLVIVESPAKAKTINKILGGGYVVTSSVGHVRDLPERNMGVDIEHGFKPEYVVMKGKRKVVDELRKRAKECGEIYLAPDPDREGEAIAWHIEALLKPGNEGKPFHRVQYNEITPAAVRRAFEHPGRIDQNRVDAQQARRVLDRIVGYMVSPMLWRKLQRGLSAGRVQSVALRLVCEREAQIGNFVPEVYWVVGANVRKRVEPLDPFTIKLIRVNDGKVDIRTPEDAARVRADLEGRALRVADIATREVSRRPLPPFITSSLQQAASSCFGFAPKRTMSIAQKLYEGVELGEGPVGLITYMRTDSFNIAAEALDACRAHIRQAYGPEYCPEKPNFYRSRGTAQEAHEAVRPTDVHRTPESVAGRLDPSELKLYRLIWQRFVASQMMPARFDQRTVKVEAVPPAGVTSSYVFSATASDVKFAGYLKAAGEEYLRPKKDESPDAEPEQRLPAVVQGELLDCLGWLSDRKETKPPPRYSEASLVKALESNGIGRPSTYAQIIATLEQRQYVAIEKRTLAPTDLGKQVNNLLVASLDALFNVTFTASMETRLDEIEKGAVEWTAMLAEFYAQFKQWMSATAEPPADASAVVRLLGALEKVTEWAAPVKNGRRTFSDEKFVQSIREQAGEAKKPISPRQHEALARIGARYRAQAPDVEAALRDSGHARMIDDPGEHKPLESTLKRLAVLKGVELSESGRKFVDSLQQRADSGRPLTPRQRDALGRVVLSHAARIENFEALKREMDLQDAPAPVEDVDSPHLLKAMACVRVWKDPVTRGRRVFDDKAFYESLLGQFNRRGGLSDKQRAALKRMVGKYRAQIPHFEEVARTCGLKVAPAEPKGEVEQGGGLAEV